MVDPIGNVLNANEERAQRFRCLRHAVDTVCQCPIEQWAGPVDALRAHPLDQAVHRFIAHDETLTEAAPLLTRGRSQPKQRRGETDATGNRAGPVGMPRWYGHVHRGAPSTAL